MKRFLLVIAFALVSSVAFGQTVEQKINLTALGWGEIHIQPIDADGDPTTDEWLVKDLTGRWRYRVVAVREQRLCIGAWFSPNIISGFTVLRGEWVSKRMGKDKLIFSLAPLSPTGDQREVVVVALELPACH